MKKTNEKLVKSEKEYVKRKAELRKQHVLRLIAGIVILAMGVFVYFGPPEAFHYGFDGKDGFRISILIDVLLICWSVWAEYKFERTGGSRII